MGVGMVSCNPQHCHKIKHNSSQWQLPQVAAGTWQSATLSVAAGTCEAPLIDGDNVKYLGSDRAIEKVPRQEPSSYQVSMNEFDDCRNFHFY